MQYLIYLRKSRADKEAELRGEGETLARHEKMLLELARRQHLPVGDIYREVVSGETIASRPMMQRLLSEVEQGVWDGVLVVEVERLARGDTIDQGIVAQAFKFSDTKIITPIKTYDPNNEYDEEYFEFGLFMSRREYKTIKRRLNNGRIASAKEGKYLGNKPPYGYERIKIENDKGFTLKPIESEAQVVRMIFRWYAYGDHGISIIADKLNEMAIPSKTGKSWVYPSVRDLLQSPVYIGKIRWGWRGEKKNVQNGIITHSRPRAQDCILVDGLHPAIIDEELFNQVQYKFAQHKPLPTSAKSMKNPFAGLIICAKCGSKMQRRPYQKENIRTALICTNNKCKNVSVPFESIEKRILESLSSWIDTEKIHLDNGDPVLDDSNLRLMEEQLLHLDEESSELKKQNDNIHDFLEKGIYDVDTFLERSKKIANRISEIEELEEKLKQDIINEKKNIENATSVIPKAEQFLQIYDNLSIQERNSILKEILYSIEYERDVSIRDGGTEDNFTLVLNPKLHYK